jgi:hypothetical protein
LIAWATGPSGAPGPVSSAFAILRRLMTPSSSEVIWRSASSTIRGQGGLRARKRFLPAERGESPCPHGVSRSWARA